MGWIAVDHSVESYSSDATKMHQQLQKALNQEALAELRHIMSSLLSEQKAPAYAIGIFDTQGMLLSWGDAAAGSVPRALNERSVFRIASMSKSFTAAAVLRLAEQGALNLHAPVRDYLPRMRILDTLTSSGLTGASTEITVHHLLSMSSGLVEDDAWADRQESMSRNAFLTLLGTGIRPAYAPGRHYAYSNLGYAILGELVHTVSGISLPEYVSRYFLIPLALTDTSYDWRRVNPDNLQPGYHRHHQQSGQGAYWVKEEFTEPGAFSAIGGVLSSVRDVSKWCRYLEASNLSENLAYTASGEPSGTVLSPSMRSLMQQGHTPIPPVLRCGDSAGHAVRTASSIESYGYGLIVEHDVDYGDIAYHSGGYPGYGSHMRWHLDSGLGVVVLANGRYAEPGIQAGSALRMVLSVSESVGRRVALWPETWHAVDEVNGALEFLATTSHCGDALCPTDISTLASACQQALIPTTGLWSSNVVLDATLESRARVLAQEIGFTGLPKLFADGNLHIHNCHSYSPASFSWTVDCTHGLLRCEVSLIGINEQSTVQTVSFSHVSTVHAGTVVERSATSRAMR
jgi:CubicO group peptidase (beta-lactamase class C family)